MWVDKLKVVGQDFLNDESGATTVEYTLIAGLIATAIIVSTSTLGNHIGEDLDLLGNTIDRQDLNTGHVD